MLSAKTTSLYFATTSEWKYRQGKAFLEDHGITLMQAKIELPESRNEDVLDIAREKADFAYKRLGEPVIVIDGAFHIRQLNGFPKTFVKFAEKYIGARGIITLMQDAQDRSYEWPNVLVYRSAEVEKYFIGYIRGRIVAKLPAGASGNDFGLIQQPDGYLKTFAQMDREELRHFEANVWQPTIFEEFSRWYVDMRED